MEKKEVITKVHELILKHGLNTASRKQHLLYQRYYLYSVLSNRAKMSLVDIGKMFNKDHSTIIHGLKMHELLIDLNDITYKLRTSHLKDEFGEIHVLRDLENDVLKCSKMSNLNIIKHKIKTGYYAGDVKL